MLSTEFLVSLLGANKLLEEPFKKLDDPNLLLLYIADDGDKLPSNFFPKPKPVEPKFLNLSFILPDSRSRLNKLKNEFNLVGLDGLLPEADEPTWLENLLSLEIFDSDR